jgi:hypothetical protein
MDKVKKWTAAAILAVIAAVLPMESAGSIFWRMWNE